MSSVLTLEFSNEKISSVIADSIDTVMNLYEPVSPTPIGWAGVAGWRIPLHGNGASFDALQVSPSRSLAKGVTSRYSLTT